MTDNQKGKRNFFTKIMYKDMDKTDTTKVPEILVYLQTIKVTKQQNLFVSLVDTGFSQGPTWYNTTVNIFKNNNPDQGNLC